MSDREPYAPGAASGAEVRKEGDRWTLVLVRDLQSINKMNGVRTPGIDALA